MLTRRCFLGRASLIAGLTAVGDTRFASASAGAGGGQSVDAKLVDRAKALVTRYPYLFAELLRRGYSDDDVLKIAGRNHLRALRQMEGVAAQLEKSEPPLTVEGPRYGMETR